MRTGIGAYLQLEVAIFHTSHTSTTIITESSHRLSSNHSYSCTSSHISPSSHLASSALLPLSTPSYKAARLASLQIQRPLKSLTLHTKKKKPHATEEGQALYEKGRRKGILHASRKDRLSKGYMRTGTPRDRPIME